MSLSCVSYVWCSAVGSTVRTWVRLSFSWCLTRWCRRREVSRPGSARMRTGQSLVRRWPRRSHRARPPGRGLLRRWPPAVAGLPADVAGVQADTAASAGGARAAGTATRRVPAGPAAPGRTAAAARGAVRNPVEEPEGAGSAAPAPGAGRAGGDRNRSVALAAVDGRCGANRCFPIAGLAARRWAVAPDAWVAEAAAAKAVAAGEPVAVTADDADRRVDHSRRVARRPAAAPEPVGAGQQDPHTKTPG